MVLLFLLGASLASVAADSTRTTLEVQNLSCGACLSRINEALEGMEGFKDMDADLYQKMVAVDHQKPLTAAMIAETVTGLGYPATILSETELEGETDGPPADKWYSRGVGCRGCNNNSPCGGNASSWKEFYYKYFGNRQ